jgi:hypothetical protein
VKLETSAKWRGCLALILLAIGAVYIGLALQVSSRQTSKQPPNLSPTVVGKAKPHSAGKKGGAATPDAARAEQNVNESLAGVLVLAGMVFIVPGFYLASRWWKIKRRMQEMDYLGRAIR